MEHAIKTLKESPLFLGIAQEDIPGMLACLSAERRTFPRRAYIFHAGDRAGDIGIVLSGGVHIIKEDYWGNRTILAQVGPGDLFGEAFSCAGVERLAVSAVAVEESEILFLHYRKIITQCSSACIFHQRLIENLIQVLAQKNIYLTQKMEVLTKRTTREKLLSYLSTQAVEVGKGSFTIPFNRQELADYLSVDRSAMSTELGKMQAEGLLLFEKNRFTLL
ncbi:Crp/Fnr family transcriptional regulator [Eubacteriales bacterium OttesenSCG-928-M02]|nr:Crp/Fnr family transcriptional regulator [Eubacteriales bacterium OttesenSCG-928-M02]